MAEQPDAAAPAAEGKKKRKLNQLRPQTRKKLKAAKELEVQLTPEEKQRRQEQKRQRVRMSAAAMSTYRHWLVVSAIRMLCTA